jgi:abortive infection bacteriophage resistance protein
MNLKPPLSVPDQIKLLETRGMIFDDKYAANNFLERHNYYLLNAYFHKFFESVDVFEKGITFNRIVEIYKNDAWLRHQIFSVIEPIEIHLRCRISYYMATKYNSDILYQSNEYEDVKRWEENLTKINSEIYRNKNNPVIRHHITNYKSMFPIWVAAEFFSIGTLSIFYSNLKQVDRSSIAENNFGIPDEYMKSWLHSLTVLRNICAHSGYLFRREIPKSPKKFLDTDWGLPKNSKKLFSYLYVIKRLSIPEDWQIFRINLIEYVSSHQFFSVHDYGFPLNWEDIL